MQEVDLDARRTDFRDVARSLANELQMNYAYGVEFQELTQGKSGQPALHGQATLTRFPITDARVLRFENQPKDWSRDWFQPREGGRMALVTRIQTPGAEFVIYNVHLESRGGAIPGAPCKCRKCWTIFRLRELTFRWSLREISIRPKERSHPFSRLPESEAWSCFLLVKP